MYDVIIIGAGPAGLSAAIYAGRFRMNTLVLEKTGPGGQILLSPSIENYPGFPEGISTYDLVDRFKKQVEGLGIAIESAEVIAIDKGQGQYAVKTPDASYQSRALVIASGAEPRHLGVSGEDKFIGRGVSYCATCDGPLFKGKKIIVVGGGDRAIEEAIFLAEYASQVSLVHRRRELRASAILVERAKSNPRIKFILDSVIEDIAGESKVAVVRLKNLKTGSQEDLACEGVFMFVGIKPNTEFLKNTLELDADGFIITDDEMAASQEGVFACGDCRKKSLYQVISACADGAVAADSAHKYLMKA